MLSPAKHLARTVGVSTPSGVGEMLREAQHDGLFYFLQAKTAFYQPINPLNKQPFYRQVALAGVVAEGEHFTALGYVGQLFGHGG